MIDMQFLGGALLALAIVIGAAIALSLAMFAAASFSQPGRTAGGQTPRGGTRRDLPRQSAPDDDNARELVLR
jgi:hypothetical protein